MAIIEGTPTKDKRKYSFKVYYKDLQGNTKQYLSKKYTLKSEAKEAERNYLINLTDKIENKSINFSDLINQYLSFQKEKVKISSFNNYHKMYFYLESIKKIKVNDFNISQFNRWKEEINKNNLSTIYKNNIYKFLRSILNYANKYLNANTNIILNKMTGFSNPNEIKKEMLFFTYQDFLQFINEENDIVFKSFFKTLYYCGLRKGEANSLNWKDVDFKNKVLSINKNLTTKIKGNKYILLPTKTKGSNRILPIPDTLLFDLIELKDYYKKFNNYDENWFVFGGIFPLADTTIEKRKNDNCKKAKVKRIRIHDFRHSCASLLINSGASIPLVAKYLGHSNITTTLNTYTHMFKNELNDIVNTLNNLEK